jgi:hypothetical protein
LGTPDISTWDEVVHVNVVKNLAEHCCVPELHRSSLGTDYRDWGNNTVWLHKPLLPFYATAAFYRILGGSLWAFRLPGAIFALLTALVIYLIGSKFFDENIGLLGAAIFGLNPFTNALVHGTTYSGFPDLFFAFFISLALYLILDWTQTKSVVALRWLGFVIALAYLSKGGLALAPFAVLALVALQAGNIRELVPALQSVAVFLIVVLPDKLYWRVHDPVESGYEQRQQVLHLFKNIEGHGAPWHFYFSHAFPHILVPALVPLAYFSIGWALLRFRRGAPGQILSVWCLAYLVPLSFGVSKIDNFIFAVLPAIALLTPLVVESLMRSGRYRLVFSLCIASIASYLLWQTAVLSRTIEGLVLRSRWHEHPIWFSLLATMVALAAGFVLWSVLNFDPKLASTSALALTSLGLVLLYVHTNISDNWVEPVQVNGLNSTAQLPLRETGTRLRNVVDKNALVIVALDDKRSEDSVAGFFACGPGPVDCVQRLAYLYIMYWSDADVLDVCRDPYPGKAVERFRGRQNIYLITNKSLPTRSIGSSPIGDIYSLRDVPFDVWAPVAGQACSTQPPMSPIQPMVQASAGR